MNQTEIRKRINELEEQSSTLWAEIESLRQRETELYKTMRHKLYGLKVDIADPDPDGHYEDYFIALVDEYCDDPYARKQCLSRLRSYYYYQRTSEEERMQDTLDFLDKLKKLEE